MAETKRNSVAGKVATPKTATPATNTAASNTGSAGQTMVDTLEALGKSIGARVKLTTAAPHSQTYEGTLFTACPTLNLVAINTRSPPPNPSTNSAALPGDYHIIPVSRIQNFQLLALASGTEGSESNFANAQPPIGAVDVKRLQQREDERIRKLKEEEQHRGRGVTSEGQALYDALKKINLPIRWHNQEMIVHDAVIISPPYQPENCKGAKDKQEVLNRVKKVLEGERKKLLQRAEQERSKAGAPASNAPRKGG